MIKCKENFIILVSKKEINIYQLVFINNEISDMTLALSLNKFKGDIHFV